MAIHEVSTWGELANAINGFANGDVIKLKSDIDLNKEFPLGVESCNITQSSSGSYTLTIDGDGHKIRNLRTSISDPHSILMKNTDTFSITLTLQNIDFVNLILSGAALIYVNGSNDDAVVCNNCRFVGNRTAGYLINRNRNVLVNSCYFDMPWQGGGLTTRQYISLIPWSTEATTAYANYCWFHEHYTGWVMPQGWDWGWTTDSTYFSFSYFKINGCYIDGDSVCTRYKISNTDISNCLKILAKANVSSYAPASQNVLDCDIVVMNGMSNNTIEIANMCGLMKKSVVNSSSSAPSITTYNNCTQSLIVDTSKPYPLKATPEQMKDATWLYNNGFDIIVPPSE